ncbi:hypothetical protein BDN72DRAFT_834506 [Pluteus cervinus]|uniref:Uncharacterized protein n=1 Tax=Pluteus cervinus TaxID=181527 RepID=A0ACD3B9F4_9AGAR|nr:hypothetical protein BDN72DRAFT_834506 [Pluteus cervinus]
MLRTVVLATATVAVTYILLTSIPLPYLAQNFLFNHQMSQPVSASWVDEARPHPNPHAFEPTQSSLALSVFRNAPVEHEGFTLALFHPNDVESEPVAVTRSGRVLYIPTTTFGTLLGLVDQVRGLPSTETFRNTWSIQQDRTSQPIERLVTFPTSTSISANDRAEQVKEIGVQGFDGTKSALKKETAGFTSLPEPLFELTGLVLKARDEQTEDRAVLDKVRGVVDRWL